MSPSPASSGAPWANGSSGAPRVSAPTDAGSNVVESLYRGASGQPGLLRPYEPSLRPPEGTSDYGWLFRPDQPEGTAVAPSASDDLSSTGQQSLGATTSGLAAVLPAWPLGIRASARRWPAAALLAVGLMSGLLLPWLVRSV